MTELALQPSLFATGGPSFDPALTGVVRHELADGAWVDHLPEWLAGSDDLFAALVEALDWRQRSMRMYDRVVDQPRLTVPLARDEPAPAPLVEVRTALERRYGTRLGDAWCNLYRTGRDSVAWHGDRVLRDQETGLVCILSLGERRPFLLRPAGGGSSTRFELGRGDLLVMGGTCQRTWRHSVPKVARAGPRISVTWRPIQTG